MNGIKWLQCTASAGQFRDEVAVHGQDFEGNEFSLFTALEYIRRLREPSGRDDEVPALLQVRILDKQRGLCLVRLPGQTFVNGSTITVREENLEDSPARQHA